MMKNLLMITILTAVAFGSTVPSKFVCNGGSVILFDKDLVDIIGKEASLYLTQSGALIATWNSSQFIYQKHGVNVYRDRFGNLWIGNIDQEDKGIYSVQHSKDGKILRVHNQELTVLVAPARNCSPKISRTNITLVASVEGTECGIPKPSVYFVQYEHFSYVSETLVTLTPGKETGTYFACLKTPALRCVTSLKPSDLCTYFTISESTYQVIPTESMSNIRAIEILYFIWVFVGFTAVILYIEFCIKRHTVFLSKPGDKNPRTQSTPHQIDTNSQETAEIQADPQHEEQIDQPCISLKVPVMKGFRRRTSPARELSSKTYISKDMPTESV